ncbi:hypothetical protein Aoki45_26380 [Algoriphagus sp. oki45]|uniref:hypothetical protein n=1 Tax=Algoriphagus sp. oki45 TaxID=3067294 RepID=UPI0027EDE5F7|nr:hypothetical protein Aoki45_26380 [Algoriphagus sp. oki45]
MKHLFLFSFFLVLAFNGFAQQSILVKENWINFRKYYSQGIPLSKTEVADVMKDYPKLQEEYIKGNKKLNSGMWFMISGGIVATSAIVWIYSYPDFGLEGLFIPMGIAAGLPFFLIGRQFRVSGRSKIDFAISTFNDSQIDLKRKKSEVYLNITAAGIGLGISF